MRKALATSLLAGALATASLGLAAGGEAQTESPATTCAPDSLGQARTIIHQSYALKRYKKHPALGPESRATLDALRACLSHDDSLILAKYQAKQKDELRLYREYREVTPFKCLKGAYGYYAIPCYVISCESHFSWSAHNPSGADGPYQILSDPVPMPANTRKKQLVHHRIAHRYYVSSGLGPWVCA